MTDKNDLYDAKHRLPSTGTVQGQDGRIWHGKGNGYWHTGEAGQAAVRTAKLSDQHGPLIRVP